MRSAEVRGGGRVLSRLWPMVAGAGLLLVASGLAGVASAGPAEAHTALVASDPVDGASVPTLPSVGTLTFSEDIAPEFADVAVTGPGDSTMTLPATAVSVKGPVVSLTLDSLAAGAPAGTWEVLARVTSADGHPVEVMVSFTTENPGPTPVPPTVTAAPGSEVPASGGTSLATAAPRATSSTTGNPSVPGSSASTSTDQVEATSSTSSVNPGAILAAVIGAVVVTAIVIAVSWRRRRS